MRVHVCTECSNEASAESTAAARLITTKALTSDRTRLLPSRPDEEGASANKASIHQGLLRHNARALHALKKTAHGPELQEGCAARSWQGSEARVSKQRAHSVGSVWRDPPPLPVEGV